MAQYSWTIENNSGTAYLDIALPTAISAKGDTFTYTFPSAKVKGNNSSVSASASRYYRTLQILLYQGNTYTRQFKAYGNTGTVANSSTWATFASAGSREIPTADYFNENNKTTKSITLTPKVDLCYLRLTGSGDFPFWPATPKAVGSTVITLDVPPTFENDPIAYDTNFADPYAGLTTASVDIDTLTAYYGGYIARATLTIGNQSDELTGDDQDILSSGTLSILLGSVGTFTPTITVEDSRGQTKTVTLADITVKGYTAPQIVVNELIRTDANGTANDEGECAVVTAALTWTSAITNLTEPTVVAKELNDTLVPTETKWYTDRALQNAISDWSAVSNMPIYAFIGNNNTPPNPFDTQDSFNITITPNDGEGSGTPVTNTLGSAFYTVDFLAGGHGIAFGKPAETQELFECDLNAQFNKQVLAPNYFVQLDTTGQSGTIDDDIYNALVDLGWDSEVIV